MARKWQESDAPKLVNGSVTRSSQYDGMTTASEGWETAQLVKCLLHKPEFRSLHAVQIQRHSPAMVRWEKETGRPLEACTLGSLAYKVKFRAFERPPEEWLLRNDTQNCPPTST